MPEVHSSIFHLQKLESLNVSGCTSLKSLSSNTCSPALRYLNAMYCNNLKDISVPFASVDGLEFDLTEWDGNELPSSILHTQNIKNFIFPISDCLVDLPENFCDYILLTSQQIREHDPFITLDKVLSSPAFLSLKHLYLYKIPMLSEIPDSISLLSSLQCLTLNCMAIKSLPETIMYLPQLKAVPVNNCKLLQSIPALRRFIPFLGVWGCESLEKVLSSTVEPYGKPTPGSTVLLNCKKLDPHSYQTVLKDTIDGIELGAKTSNLFLPAMPGMENWFHYLSTQVCFTLELPSNLLGFAYYLVLSQGRMRSDVGFGCECYLDNSSGERICITSFTKSRFLDNPFNDDASILSDHLVLWYDPRICKQIMDAVEQTKSITDVNNTSYNPKLTFTFFIDETIYHEVEIKECGFHWIYLEETVSSTIPESHDEEETVFSSDFQSNVQEEIVPPTNFESGDLEETTPPSNPELDETYDLRYSLEVLLNHMNTTWFGSTEDESNN